MIQVAENIVHDLEEKLARQKYKGWDVYDGLNSKLIENLPFASSRLFRLFWIQLHKRSPINLRMIAGIPQGQNPKGLALFIRSYVNLYKNYKEDHFLAKAREIAEALIALRSSDREYFCWGYDFPWEARAFSVPRFKPNMIVSSFAAHAFLDLYEIEKNDIYLHIADDVARFILTELCLYDSRNEICFGYIPGEQTRVHNANLMGALLLARLYYILKKQEYKDSAIKSIHYTLAGQRSDGAWVYGENTHHSWVDNFHTGYNLIALVYSQKYLEESFAESISKGLEFHIKNHFTDEFIPKYYDNKLFPIDIHNFAQGIITFTAFNMQQNANKLINQSISLMYNLHEKCFYYQKNKYILNKIPYIRWSQAWMFYALSCNLLNENERK